MSSAEEAPAPPPAAAVTDPLLGSRSPDGAGPARLAMGLRILVVDDDPDVCASLEMLLTREGFEVTSLTDPSAVLGELRSREYHLVVLDLLMPTMSGTEVLEQIRRLDEDIAVVIATAHPSVETAIASVRHQASDYVRKPFLPGEFLTTVRAALARRSFAVDPEAALLQGIGRVIRQARQDRNLTLKQLARRTGLSVSLLSQVERTGASTSIGSLYRIARALRLKMTDLFRES